MKGSRRRRWYSHQSLISFYLTIRLATDLLSLTIKLIGDLIHQIR
jgi:hypothetical protein